jgi:hypothetical protein
VIGLPVANGQPVTGNLVMSSIWSISVECGRSPFALKPSSDVPLLTAADIDDVPATFVADPFMVRRRGEWHMFLEVLNAANGLGEIGHATSTDGRSWKYRGIVLREPFHLSYPGIVRWNGSYWMIPETLGAGAVRLYRAERFPGRWVHDCDLLPLYAADSTAFRYRGRWWMFVCTTPHEHDTLALYSADELRGPWHEHPCSPIIKGQRSVARPGGRPRMIGGRLHRFAQDCTDEYGRQVRAFEILELTTTTYREREIAESPILRASGRGWNADGMHHVDAHRLPGGGWIACVDGKRFVP